MTKRYFFLLVGVLLGFTLSILHTVAWGQGGQPPVIGGQFRPMTQLRGDIVCVGCTAAEASRAQPGAIKLYTLKFDGGQLVMNVEWVSHQSRQYLEDVAGLADTLYIRAPQNILQELTAEEHLFKEVQMKLDRETDQTIQVAVLENPILREATEIELARNQRMTQLAGTESSGIEMNPWWKTTKKRHSFLSPVPSETSDYQSRQWRTDDRAHRTFSDRDRVRIERVIEEIASLPLGQRRGFYRTTLEQQGYDILATRVGPTNHVQYKAMKDKQPVLLTVVFADDTNMSTALSAIPVRRIDKMTQVEREENE